MAAGVVSSCVNRVLCSTDDAEIAAAARRAGADVPFMRPAALASDSATDLDVFKHCIEWLEREEALLPEYFVQLRPTTPFRHPEWIVKGLDMLSASPSASSVRSVTPAPISPYKMWKQLASGEIVPAMNLTGVKEAFNMPRASLPEVLWHTGQIDIIRTKTLLSGSMTGDAVLPLRVPFELAIDIDHLVDFQLAELNLNNLMPSIFTNYLTNVHTH